MLLVDTINQPGLALLETPRQALFLPGKAFVRYSRYNSHSQKYQKLFPNIQYIALNIESNLSLMSSWELMLQ